MLTPCVPVLIITKTQFQIVRIGSVIKIDVTVNSYSMFRSILCMKMIMK